MAPKFPPHYSEVLEVLEVRTTQCFITNFEG
jgi:hypothetical protein